ncbi:MULTISPECIES: hypothetical protein [unclassified Amycolatopsis]|uniref:hypothetical protein n=1 Tax=unclassified Amycolatopsis TaxID=2618356 RepID=UPI001C6A5729|nr:hypothetical protein [Amycolatopsis sp. DSM 110486]QYN18481.1 hypothetical protein K1T34_37910 [Amycolatopsis sp. DSM 110486]
MDDAAHGVVRGEAVEVGQAGQRLGADHDGEVAFELGQGRGGEVLQLCRRGERVVDEAEAQTRAGGGVGRRVTVAAIMARTAPSWVRTWRRRCSVAVAIRTTGSPVSGFSVRLR